MKNLMKKDNENKNMSNLNTIKIKNKKQTWQWREQKMKNDVNYEHDATIECVSLKNQNHKNA